MNNQPILLWKNTKLTNAFTLRIGDIRYIGLIRTDKIGNFNKQLERLKKDIENVSYNETKELQKLNSDERKFQNEITENKRKARNETDENKRKKFIFFANEAKDKWKKLLERKKDLKVSRLGDDFNPDQHIDNFLQKLQEKLTPPKKPTRTPRNPRQTTTNNDNFTGTNDTTVF